MLDRPTLLSFEYFGDHQFSQRPGTFNDSARFSPGVCFSPCSGLAFIWSPECGSAWATVANIRPVDGIISVVQLPLPADGELRGLAIRIHPSRLICGRSVIKF